MVEAAASRFSSGKRKRAWQARLPPEGERERGANRMPDTTDSDSDSDSESDSEPDSESDSESAGPWERRRLTGILRG